MLDLCFNSSSLTHSRFFSALVGANFKPKRKHSSMMHFADRTCFNRNQVSAPVGGGGGAKANKFEQVSSDGQQQIGCTYLEGQGVGVQRVGCAVRSNASWIMDMEPPLPPMEVPSLEGRQGHKGCTVRSNVLWVMVTWNPPPPIPVQLKYYLPATSLADGKKLIRM